MDERIPEILIADLLNLFRLNNEDVAPTVIGVLSWLIFILALAATFVLIKDAIRKRDDD
ncbi:MAG: hypothetical protein J4400_01545 [Candidatus Aenigmarchaeota archaeon]|nr:hypothetical protein [Candidatus Aenigmarchaeota archaeon]